MTMRSAEGARPLTLNRKVVDSHARIVDALERRDPRAAAEAMGIVIDAGLDRNTGKEGSST